MDKNKRFKGRFPSGNIIILIFFLIGLFMIICAFFDLDKVKSLVKEDAAIENMQAIFYLMGAVVWGFAIFMTLKVKGSQKRLYLFYILFLGLFLFFFFEEISWGQRLFGFSTPESLREVNVQEETNVHNIGIDNSMMWIHILMALFIITVGIILPILKLGWKKAEMVFERLKLPVVHPDLIACFYMALVFHSDPGFHWYISLMIIAVVIPTIIILSGKLRHFFNKFKNPLFQFSLVMIMGLLVIAININLDTAYRLSGNIAFEIRELFIAMALFFFSAYEAHGVWKKKHNGRESQRE